MASVTNTFSLLDDGQAAVGAAGKTKKKNKNKRVKEQDHRHGSNVPQPTSSQPELFHDGDLDDGFQAVAAKGKSRAAETRGAVDARSAAEAAERAASAPASAEDMISLLRSWLQQVLHKAASVLDQVHSLHSVSAGGAAVSPS